MHVVQDGTEEKDHGQIPASLAKKIGSGGKGKVFADGKHNLIFVSEILFKGQI